MTEHASHNGPSDAHYQELRRLLEKQCSGTATSVDLDRLQELIDEHPQAVRFYVEYLDLHAQLQWHYRGTVETAAERPTNPIDQPEPSRSIRTLFTRPASISMGVAALVIGLLITTMAIIALPVYRASLSRHPSHVVAHLTDLHQATWANGQAELSGGASLTQGQVLDLEQGLAEVTFHSGVQIIVEAPTRLILDSDGAATLDSGKLVANVPGKAIGFSISTPTAVITDLGTRFSVAVDRDGVTDAFVYIGKVSVARRLPSGKLGNPQTLVAGKGVRVTTGHQIADLPDRPSFEHRIRFDEESKGPIVPILSYKYLGETSDPRLAQHSGNFYPDDNRKKLTDGVIGTSQGDSGAWVGWRDLQSRSRGGGDTGAAQPAILLDVGQISTIGSIEVSYLVAHTPPLIYAPDRVVVSVSNDGQSFTQSLEYRGFRDDWTILKPAEQFLGYPRIAKIELDDLKARFVRLEFYNDKPWTFLSEVSLFAPIAPSEDSRPQDTLD